MTAPRSRAFYRQSGDSIKETFKIVGKRFTYGGDTAKDQRVYYINTKELGDILFGTATPIPFRVVVDESLGWIKAFRGYPLQRPVHLQDL